MKLHYVQGTKGLGLFAGSYFVTLHFTGEFRVYKGRYYTLIVDTKLW